MLHREHHPPDVRIDIEEKCSVATSVMLTIGEPLPALLTRQSSRPNFVTA
jgi:hypothetical protein